VLTLKKYYHQRSINKAQTIQIIHFRLTKLLSTLDLLNNTLINGNFVNTHNAMEPFGIAYDSSNGYIYVTNGGSDSVSVINGTTVIANITVGTEPKGNSLRLI
jgi:YVTN family beta-propeller protein